MSVLYAHLRARDHESLTTHLAQRVPVAHVALCTKLSTPSPRSLLTELLYLELSE